MHTYDIIETGSPLDKATNALILVHGRGATARDILSMARFFTDESWYIAAPQATNHTWYPRSFLAPTDRNEPWISSAINLLHTLILNVLRELPLEKIFLVGFSQGACLSAEVTARFAGKYGGIVIFTGGLIGEQLNYDNYKGNFEGTRIYLSNGNNDSHVPLQRSQDTLAQLKKMGAEAELDIFPNRAHTIIQEEIDRANAFIFN